MNLLENRSKMLLAATCATVALLLACGGNGDAPTAPSTPAPAAPTPTPGPWDGVWSGSLERTSSSIATDPAQDRVSFTIAANAVKTISISWSSYMVGSGAICPARSKSFSGTGETVDGCHRATCPPYNEFRLHGYRGDNYTLDGVGVFNATTGELRGNVTFQPLPSPADCELRLYYGATKQ